ncbi:ABC transporter permease subunit [Treponema sp.]|uniref:ABC transporter permease subunit n=1 Tax=Treponema sp. TaxID=166 RepID=UPI0025D30F14|nr:ABC transporter permease subunit [Treponema sp.]MBR4320960.1 ABC transporter permease subunit [Treponema sp.]
MNLTENLYKILIAGGSYITILKGLWMTIQGSFISVLLGTLLGGLICLLRMRKNVVIRTATAAYIAFLRGTPVLMLLLLLYYGVFARAGLSSLIVASITFALNFSAHVAELLRTSISATEKGQVEAARTLGFSRWQAFHLITLPQMLKIAKPVYQSLIVNLIQWTSVVGYVTITDLTRVINNIASRTMQPFITITIGMFIYLGLSYAIYGIFALTELKKKEQL